GWLNQYRGSANSGELRLYHALTYTVFYTDATDLTPPVIQTVSFAKTPAGVEVTARLAESGEPLHQVIATFTTGNGRWQSLALSENSATNTWHGMLPLTTAEFVVQAVDQAGNVGVNDNQGKYFNIGGKNRLYLPIVNR